MKQEDIFLKGEADAWFNRNEGRASEAVSKIIRTFIPTAESVLEVGCGYALTLATLCEHYECRGYAIDPSQKAIGHVLSHGSQDIEPMVGTANDLKLCMGFDQVDVVIYGFCLYLCDREDLPHIVYVGDIVLNDGGYLVIHDFDQEKPEAVPYKHKEGVYSYKMDHSKLWLANPAYEFVSKTWVEEGQSVTILRKTGWDKYK